MTGSKKSEQVSLAFTDGSTVPWQGTHNNACENAIRPFVVGRRNWLFADTQDGARASANLYSLLETAKANGIEPFAYLRDLFRRLPSANNADDYEALLPWNLKPVDG
jgi:transposase